MAQRAHRIQLLDPVLFFLFLMGLNQKNTGNNTVPGVILLSQTHAMYFGSLYNGSHNACDEK
jgi:hypothetical protein